MFVVMRYTKEYKEKHSRNFTFIDWKCPCGEISTMRFNTSMSPASKTHGNRTLYIGKSVYIG